MNTDTSRTRWDDLKQRLQQSTRATQGATTRDQQRMHELYRQRAVRLAMPAAKDEPGRETTRTLIFVLGDQLFGIPLCHVAQVYPACPLTPVPRAPSWVLGIANFEAQIRSVIDLANLLDSPGGNTETAGNILLIRCPTGTTAIRVDRVEEVQNIDFAQLTVPEPSETASIRLVRGMTPEQVAIVSAEALLTQLTSRRHCS